MIPPLGWIYGRLLGLDLNQRTFRFHDTIGAFFRTRRAKRDLPPSTSSFCGPSMTSGHRGRPTRCRDAISTNISRTIWPRPRSARRSTSCCSIPDGSRRSRPAARTARRHDASVPPGGRSVYLALRHESGLQHRFRPPQHAGPASNPVLIGSYHASTELMQMPKAVSYRVSGMANQGLKFRTKAQMRVTPPEHRTPRGQ